MSGFDDYLNSLSESEIAEYSRVSDNFHAACEMEEDGPKQEAALEAVYRDAKALNSAMIMAGARWWQVVSLLQRGEFAEGFRLFVPAMEFVTERANEIPETMREPMETLVLMPLVAMTDDPNVPRATIEAYLDHLEVEVKAGRGGARANLALARAAWHAHTGERSRFDGWFDQWVTGGAGWWDPQKSTTVLLTSALLSAFDPADALEYLDRREATMVGSEASRRTVTINRAGWTTLCGQPEKAWQQYRQTLKDTDRSEFDDIVSDVDEFAVICASEAAPWDSTDDDTVSKARFLLDAVEKATESKVDAIEAAAALARHYRLRNDPATGQRWQSIAYERARLFDARNETDHWTTTLTTRWFQEG